jgi:hypothetical protein
MGGVIFKMLDQSSDAAPSSARFSLITEFSAAGQKSILDGLIFRRSNFLGSPERCGAATGNIVIDIILSGLNGD